jgi:hypothetical protein
MINKLRLDAKQQTHNRYIPPFAFLGGLLYPAEGYLGT